VKGYLLVRVADDRFGLPIEHVVEVVDDAETEPMPGARRSVRGVAHVRGGTVPVVHLGALLSDGVPPADRSSTVVVTRCPDRAVAFEVTDADAVVRDSGRPVPPGSNMPWATGIASHEDQLIPILDMETLGERIVLDSGDATA
jgi:two-component system chemotaxis response regulator CheV